MVHTNPPSNDSFFLLFKPTPKVIAARTAFILLFHPKAANKPELSDIFQYLY